MGMRNNSEAIVKDFLEKRGISFRQQYLSSSDHLYYFDFYLPDGLGKIKVGDREFEMQGTIGIEVKERLLFDTIKRYYNWFKEQKSDKKIKYFILVYKDSFINNHLINDVANKLMKENFLVFSLQNFVHLNINRIQSECSESSQTISGQNEINLGKAIFSFQQGNVVLFLGAGVSKSANIPDWYGLLKGMCVNSEWESVDIDTFMEKYKGSDIVLGRFVRLFSNLKSTDPEYINKIRKILYNSDNSEVYNIVKSDLVDVICDLVETGKVKSIVTYNYDDIMEHSLEERNLKCYPVYGNNTPENIFPIYHIHGYIPRNNAESTNLPIPILSEETYHDIYADSYDWSNIEQLHAMNRSTCFFIGLSMRDPNLRRLLDISHRKSDGTCRHFLFLPMDKFFENGRKNSKVLNAQTRMFEELGLNVIWYDNKTGTHEKLPSLLREIGGYKKK